MLVRLKVERKHNEYEMNHSSDYYYNHYYYYYIAMIITRIFFVHVIIKNIQKTLKQTLITY